MGDGTLEEADTSPKDADILSEWSSTSEHPRRSKLRGKTMAIVDSVGTIQTQLLLSFLFCKLLSRKKLQVQYFLDLEFPI